MTDDARLDRMEGDISHLKRDVAEIKGTLARLEPMILRMVEQQARIDGRLIDGRLEEMPNARDFGRLEGKVEEMARRLPIPLAYTPPEEKRRA